MISFKRIDFPSLSYRKDFYEVTKILSNYSSEGAVVLGTFDIQLFTWWRLATGKYTYIADYFVSAAPGQVLRERLVSFSAQVGMSESVFEKLLDSFMMKAFWTGGLSLDPVPAIVRRDFSEYSLADANQLKKYSIFDSWDLTYTIKQRQELIEAFRNSANFTAKYRMDIVVLTNDSSFAKLAWHQAGYKNTLSNSSFRVWRKINFD